MNAGKPLESRVGDCLEVIGYATGLENASANVPLLRGRNLSPVYMCAELLWYLSRKNDITMIEYYAPSYHRFAENGKAWGAYGHRWANDKAFTTAWNTFTHAAGGNFSVNDEWNVNKARASVQTKGLHVEHLRDQLTAVVALLKKSPNTRQAIITMWNAGDLLHAFVDDKSDLPCTLSLQFIARNGLLHAIGTMRSNDIWLGLPYDVFCFTCIQQLVARALRLKPGQYFHRVGSMHLYDENKEKAVDILMNESWPGTTGHTYEDRKKGISVAHEISVAVELEDRLRGCADDQRPTADELYEICGIQLGHNTLLTDVLLTIALRHGVDTRDLIKHKTLKTLVQEHCKRKELFS